jgi:DNA mismatch repair protein MSH4
MPQVPDVDLIAASLVQIPSLVNIATAQRNVTNLLSLKKLLELAAAIAPVLQSTRNELLVAIRNTLQDDVANKLRQIVSAVISAESSIGKKPDAVKLRGQLVFALRAGLDGMLDVARTAYLHSIEQMDQLVDTYRAHWSTAALRIEYTPARGFHLSLPRDAAEQLLASEARGSVLEQVWRGKRLYFSTEELLALNSRQSDAFREVLAQTNRVLETTLDAVRQHMSWLFTVTESLALLDMLRAFAHLVSVSDQYVRPLLTADGPLAVRQGRHPVLEKTLSRHSYVPTKVFLAENCCLQVLTAPNNGGKSTYLRQIGLLVILAHSGCFVPAEWASVRVTEQLFARMTTDDEMEANAGSFMVEMRETAHIIESATARSLVLIDELGRGTSMGDGLALAWSVCEALLQRKALTVCATHFTDLTDLALLYPQAQNINLAVRADGQRLTSLFQVESGASAPALEDYGIRVAELVGFPQSVIAQARAVAAELRNRVATRVRASAQPSTRQHHTLLVKLLALKHASLPEPAMRSFLLDLRRQFSPPQAPPPTPPRSAQEAAAELS